VFSTERWLLDSSLASTGMADGAPRYCSRCGGELDSLSRTVEFRCVDCGTRTFRNPAPNARVAVVERRDGAEDRLLLAEIADSGRLADPPYHDSEWMLPGGHPEYHEQPRDAVARELAEETGLRVDPDVLVPLDTVMRWVLPDARGLVAIYAVDRAETDGSLASADDASDAQFWAPAELAEARGRQFRDLHEEPEAYATPRRVIDAATAVLDPERMPTQPGPGSS
jgi:ADP-ribose pyrophosphatase YjhB (NUDIX family)